MVSWYVKNVLGVKNGIIGPFTKEDAEKMAGQIGGEAVTIDEYAKKLIENSPYIIYKNQEGRTEKERKRRMQRSAFISFLLERW